MNFFSVGMVGNLSIAISYVSYLQVRLGKFKKNCPFWFAIASSSWEVQKNCLFRFAIASSSWEVQKNCNCSSLQLQVRLGKFKKNCSGLQLQVRLGKFKKNCSSLQLQVRLGKFKKNCSGLQLQVRPGEFTMHHYHLKLRVRTGKLSILVYNWTVGLAGTLTTISSAIERCSQSHLQLNDVRTDKLKKKISIPVCNCKFIAFPH